MSAPIAPVAAAGKPPASDARPRPRLFCLDAPRLEAFGQTIDLVPRQATGPVQVLLRLAAAGRAGMPVRRLTAAIWPQAAEREARNRLGDCQRCLALLLGTERSPVRVEGEFACVDGDVVEVDSLELEASLAPLLEPFAELPEDDCRQARALLARCLSTGLVFLAGFESPWAGSARYRIADSVARATKRLAIEPGPKPQGPAGPGRQDDRVEGLP